MALCAAFVAAACVLLAGHAAPARADTLEGIHKIQHVVVITQENRSFDTYFGTYPGANGIPGGVCLRRPAVRWLHRAVLQPQRKELRRPARIGSHRSRYRRREDGRLRGRGRAAGTVPEKRTLLRPLQRRKPRKQRALQRRHGLPRRAPDPELLEVRRKFVLQDDMFQSVASWSLPEHLHGISGWSARCPKKPTGCIASRRSTPNRRHTTYIRHAPSTTYSVNRPAAPAHHARRELALLPLRRRRA